MTDIAKIVEGAVLPFPNIQGRCVSCRTNAYTLRELNLADGQDGRCYTCFDKARYGEDYGTVPLSAVRAHLEGER